MSEPTHILVVDDDTRLRTLLNKFLAENGYLVTTAADAAEARARMTVLSFDIIVLDVMMPGEDGMAFTRSLRAEGNRIPVLLLTARGEVDDRITGLEAGADDYLPKPFDPRELLLRLASILRRSPREESASTREMGLGAFVWDLERRELRQDGQPVHLTQAERDLLAILAETPGEGVARDDLAARTGASANPRTVDVLVTRLRKKIEDDPKLPRYLQTVRGTGYLLRPD